jgi:YggT family protein
MSGAKWIKTRQRPLPLPPRTATSDATGKERPMTSLYDILMMILNLAVYIILAHVLMSWLINFQVLNIRQPLVAQIWHGLHRLLEPVYGPIRRMMPAMGGLDLTPLIVLLILYSLRIILANNVGAFV